MHAVSHHPVSEGSGEPIQDAYGPTMLAVLEHIAHRLGIRPFLGQVWFSLGGGEEYDYEAVFYDHRYSIRSDGKRALIRVDGHDIATRPCGQRIVTDRKGQVLETVPIEDEERNDEHE